VARVARGVHVAGGRDRGLLLLLALGLLLLGARGGRRRRRRARVGRGGGAVSLLFLLLLLLLLRHRRAVHGGRHCARGSGTRCRRVWGKASSFPTLQKQNEGAFAVCACARGRAGG
jgi:hypothetical protein